MNNQSLEQGIQRILPLLIHFIKQCYRAHNSGFLNGRNEILTLIDMCVESLFQLEIDPKEIETIIVSLGFRAFPRSFTTIEWYLNRILPGYLEDYEQLSIESEESTMADFSEDDK